MTFSLKTIIPWGRSFDEYVAMFALSDADLAKRLFGCGDGPAAFNSIVAKRGGRVVSADPMYRLSAEEIRLRINRTFDEVLRQTVENSNEFVWSRIASPADLAAVRMEAMNEFLADYTQGLRQGRYREASLPVLPFRDNEFDIALCSHLLFLYSAHLSEDFHLASIRELCRVAPEARIFPLVELGSVTSRHLDAVMKKLTAEGFGVVEEIVDYEFQRGGNKLLKVTAG